MWKRKFRFQDCNETLLLVIRLIAALVALLSALKHFRPGHAFLTCSTPGSAVQPAGSGYIPARSLPR
jgi:hypothetical protein